MVTCKFENRIAVITVDNPPMNPLCVEVMDGLRNSFEQLLLEDDVRCVILTGTGKAFIAGADIKELKRWTAEASIKLNGKGQALANQIENFPAPVICAINGWALGGGLELAMACDFRLMSTKAKVGLPEATLGIMPGYGGTARLPRTIGIGAAKKAIYTSQHITADEALRLGLVEEVLEPEDLMPRAMELAAKIAENAPLAVQNDKRTINSMRGKSLDEALASELKYAAECYASEDSTIGIDAFINKEKPEFINK